MFEPETDPKEEDEERILQGRIEFDVSECIMLYNIRHLTVKDH